MRLAVDATAGVVVSSETWARTPAIAEGARDGDLAQAQRQPGIRAGWFQGSCPRLEKSLQTHHFCIRRRNDLRSGGRRHALRELLATAGVVRGFAGGISAGRKEAGGRLRLRGQQNRPVCRTFTGATGLEPATSGVTGRS